jgi:ketosteroid isomerase-like protein
MSTSAAASPDANSLSAVLTDDSVFEDTSPDGRRIEGKVAVVEFWRGWFVRNADARFAAEEVIVSGSRATVRWVYHKMRDGQSWHLRGIDIFTVRDGKVAAKLACATSKGEDGAPIRSTTQEGGFDSRSGSDFGYAGLRQGDWIKR